MATKKPKRSEAKAKVAADRPRVNGRFVSTDPEKADKLKRQAEDIELAIAGSDSPDAISEEDREYFGTDSQKFFEVALKNAKTYFDGYKYAKELKNLQHPSLSAVQSKQEVEVTTRVLRWDWEADITEQDSLPAPASLPSIEAPTDEEGTESDEG